MEYRNDPSTDTLEPPSNGSVVSLSEIVSALSFALDLVEDARPGHAIRSCLLGVRIARQLGLPDDQQADLYYALLLKDAGCSSNAPLVLEWVGGDDRSLKRQAKLLDWTKRSFDSVRLMWRNGPAIATWKQRFLRLWRMATAEEPLSTILIQTRCQRGMEIAIKMGMSTTTAEAIHSLDEHWDGRGAPVGLVGDTIPLFARILAVAQHLDIFGAEFGPRTAIVTLQERSGRWFDPDIVTVVTDMHREEILWQELWSGHERDLILESEPGRALPADDERIDRISQAFANVVDAKSGYTYQHSLKVTEVTVAIALQMGLAPERVRTLYRAGLLHDIGKLRVPNVILEKPGPLDPEELSVVREHPGLSQEILQRIGALAEVAIIAGSHHEKLDGSGYPRGLRGEQISLETRILTLADMYSAMIEDRPYRKQRPLAETLAILRLEVPHRIDPNCFRALLAHLAETDWPLNDWLTDSPCQPQRPFSGETEQASEQDRF